MYRNKFTIVLPIKERHAFTLRWLRFAKDIGIKSKIIIADGSTDNEIGRFLNKNLSYKILNIEYKHYPSMCNRTFDEASEFINRVADSLLKVTTEYVVITANDDFIFEEGINNSIEFLSNNKDYSSASGDTFRFRVKDTINEIYNCYGSFRNIEMFPYYDEPETVHNTSIIDRLKDYYTALSITTWKDVKRTADVIENLKLASKLPNIDSWFFQYLIDTLTKIQGKHKKVFGLYSLIQTNPGTSVGTKMMEQNKYNNEGFFLKLFSENWNNKLNDIFLNEIVKKINNGSNDDSKEMKDRIRLIFLNGVIKPRIVSEALDWKELGRFVDNTPVILTGQIKNKSNLFWLAEDILEKIHLLTLRIFNKLKSYNVLYWKQRPGLFPIGPYQKEMKLLRHFLKNDELI
jgi:glycosyltransferase domain-containing protein